jgi:hypothetical protein
MNIAERVGILSHFHTNYKSMENRAQGLNAIWCGWWWIFQDVLSQNALQREF